MWTGVSLRTSGRTAMALTAAAFLSAGVANAQESVTVGYQQIVGPFLSAIADGSIDKALADAGYKAEWRQFSSGGDISTALASGDVPIGVIGSTGLTAAASRGVDVAVFWILDNIGKSEALVARNGSGINSPADLKGKKVAVPFVSTSHFHLLAGLTKMWDINPRDVQLLNLAPPQIVAAWQRGDIDAAYVWPPALSELKKDGTVIADSEQIGAATVPTFDGLVASTSWAEKNPKFMEAFTKALAAAYADYKEHGKDWTADSPQIQGMVKLIGGNAADIASDIQLLGFPTADEQASATWLGGGKEGGALRALGTSAEFLKDQKQIDAVLDDYSPFVLSTYAEAASK
ncbi:taurine ABC transporter substrate-binding protein [Paracoccus suum]|uniref:Taurine ABC transporter substrate-binding protein n=2 Tax=Paracoccus suum TaxID=2259340 RepID=A0A344PP00_9RHOB|nr:taurine ABC transporter substrate-binding protein [Paracoccus suum]